MGNATEIKPFLNQYDVSRSFIIVSSRAWILTILYLQTFLLDCDGKLHGFTAGA